MTHARPDSADEPDVGNVEDLEPLARRGEGDFNAEFDQAVTAFRSHEAEHRASRGMWLAHHWPDEYDRCVILGGRHICRRCLVLHPLALVVAIASLAGLPPWPEALDLWFIWGLCLPATLEFLAEQLRIIDHSARRQMIATVLLAPALGRGMAHELADRWSWEFWGPVLVFGTVWFIAALVGNRDPFSGADHG